METKKCSKCECDKELSEFFKSKRNKDGVRSQCKICESKSNNLRESKYRKLRKKYRQTETYKQIKRDYYQNNKEKILSENANWRQTFKGRLLSYKRAAKKRNIEWLLSEDEFKSFWGINCSYCNCDIKTIGIDRIENEKPYTIDNCQSCCSTCNSMKMDLSEDEFINIIKKILRHLNK